MGATLAVYWTASCTCSTKSHCAWLSDLNMDTTGNGIASADKVEVNCFRLPSDSPTLLRIPGIESAGDITGLNYFHSASDLHMFVSTPGIETAGDITELNYLHSCARRCTPRLEPPARRHGGH